MDLTQLRHIWTENDFRPGKKLGQNFLIDKNIRDKIINSLCLKSDSVCVEIGFGFGMMTFCAAERCGELVAIEKDKRIFEIMAPLLKEKKNITLICADILELDLALITGRKKNLIIFGNIPYCASTPIIAKMVKYGEYVSRIYITVQEELADRIISCPGSKKYGAISCFVRFYTKPKKLFRIKRSCFYPKPKVESCLLCLEVLKKNAIPVKDKDMMFKIIRKAFSERRKKIINPLSDGSFKNMGKDAWENIFKKCGISPSSRAESLSLSDYAKVSDATLLHVV